MYKLLGLDKVYIWKGEKYKKIIISDKSITCFYKFFIIQLIYDGLYEGIAMPKNNQKIRIESILEAAVG
jgi:hypothetical protein